MAEQVRHIDVDAAHAGQRIDNFINRELKGVPRSLIYRLLRRGQVRVNGGRAKPAYRLRAGDRLRLPPVREGRAQTTTPSEQILERLRAATLHEDDEILVINKPSGLAVHGGSGLGYGVIEALRILRPDCRFLDLAHRLDRDTSGCLVIAKRRPALKRVHAAFREGAVGKQYQALLSGRLPHPVTPVEAKLQRQTGPGGEAVMRVSAAGKPARSVFHRDRSLPGDWTLANVVLHSGRMHQIRAHAAHLGAPVAGDQRYGDPERNRRARGAGLRRLFLHARELRLPQAAGDDVVIRAALPAALEAVIDRIDSRPVESER